MNKEISYTYYYKELIHIGSIKSFIRKYSHSELLLMFYQLDDDLSIKLIVNTKNKKFIIESITNTYSLDNFLDSYEKLKEEIFIYEKKQ